MDSILLYVTDNPLELAATLTGLASVWLNAKENIWGWIWGLVCVAFYTYIFWQTKLYADAGLQVAFGASSLYGIWLWTRGGAAKTKHPVTTTPKRVWAILIVSVALSTLGLGYYLATYTQDPRPWIDAALTTISLAAQYQLAKKYLENWLVWIGVDIVCVFLYIDQALYYTAFLYFAYIGIAVWGYLEWRKILIPMKQKP